MPVGVLINNALVALGGILGGMLGPRISENIKENLNQLFGFAALGIGVTLIVKVTALGAVILSLILGTWLGSALQLEIRVQALFSRLNAWLLKKAAPDAEYMSRFSTLLVLCCCGATGIFGSMNEALSGDNTTILCKAILDFFTVMIFATLLGKFTAIIALPQMAILLTVFFFARQIAPWMTAEVMGNFSATGGIIELIIGLRILKLSSMKAIDTLPSLLLIFPVSFLWQLLF